MVSAVFAAGAVGLRYDPLGRLYEVTDTNGSQRRLPRCMLGNHCHPS